MGSGLGLKKSTVRSRESQDCPKCEETAIVLGLMHLMHCGDKAKIDEVRKIIATALA
jgi:hypothetical protein